MTGVGRFSDFFNCWGKLGASSRVDTGVKYAGVNSRNKTKYNLLEEEDAVLKIYGTPISAQTFARPVSLSSWKMLCTPTGAIKIGLSVRSLATMSDGCQKH